MIDTDNGQFDLNYESSRNVMERIRFMPRCHNTAHMSISLDDDEQLYGLGDGCRGHLQMRGIKPICGSTAVTPYLPIPSYEQSGLGNASRYYTSP